MIVMSRTFNLEERNSTNSSDYISVFPMLIMRLQNGQLMFSQPHCRVELFGALIRFTVMSPVCNNKVQTWSESKQILELCYLLFIGCIQGVILEMPWSDHVFLGVFRYKGRICCTMERFLKIHIQEMIQYATDERHNLTFQLWAKLSKHWREYFTESLVWW